jgi:hypothetical protein
MAALADLGGDLLQALEASAGDHNGRTGIGEHRGEATAESGGSAGYQCDLTAEIGGGVRERKPVGRVHHGHRNHFS